MFTALRQYFLAALGIVIVVLAFYGVYQHIQHLEARNEIIRIDGDLRVERTNVQTLTNALKASQDALEAAEVALTQHQAELAELRKRQEATDAKLRQALRDNRDWSNTPLPPGVRDAIRPKG